MSEAVANRKPQRGGGRGPRDQRTNSANADGNEIELDTRSLVFGVRRFYVDVRQNLRGKFMRLTEVRPNGFRARILMTISAAAQISDKIKQLNDTQKNVPEKEMDDAKRGAAQKNRLVCSETVLSENRRYYIDVRENDRGRFLRMTMMNVAQRVQIALPVPGGLEQLVEAFNELIPAHLTPEAEADSPVKSEKAGSDPEDMKNPDAGIGQLESQSFRAPRRTFYFDVGNNRQGMYLRISEVRSTYRTAIVIPDQHWSHFAEVLSNYVSDLELARKQLREAGEKNAKRLAEMKTDEVNGDVKEKAPTVKSGAGDTIENNVKA